MTPACQAMAGCNLQWHYMCSRRDDVEVIVSAARDSIAMRLKGSIARRGVQATAELCGVSRQQLDRWMKRGAPINPELPTLIGLSVGLDVPVPELLGLGRDGAVDELASERESRTEDALRDILQRAEAALRGES